MSAAARKPAPRLARPAARYWKGKAPKGVDAAGQSDSDSEAEDEGNELQEDGDVMIRDVEGEDEEEEEDGLDVRKQAVQSKLKTKGINVALRDVNISKDGKVIVAGREEVGRTQAELGELSRYWLTILQESSHVVFRRRRRGRRGGRGRGRRGRGMCAHSFTLLFNEYLHGLV